MNITLRVGRRLSRALTVTGAAALIAGLGLVAIAPGAIANDESDSAVGNPNGECPDGTVLLAKYNWSGSSYVAEEGDDIVTSVSGDTTGGTFVVADGYDVTVVIVKGGTDVEYDDDGDNTFTSDGLENNGGQTPAISNVQFCGSVTSTDTSTTSTDTTTTSTDTGSTTSTSTSTTATDTGSTTSTTTSTTATDTGSTTSTDTTTTSTDTGSTTSTTTQPATTTTTSASVLPTVVTSTPAASTSPAVQPAVLARTGLETWTVALVAGLLLLGGGAMVALGAGTAPSTRRH